MKRSGFSMIELVFVIVILGVLAAVAVPRFVATRTDAQVATARSDLASAQKAIVAKVFADNIDATQSKAPDPNKAVRDQVASKDWGDWIIEVAGLDGARWQKGGKAIGTSVSYRTVQPSDGIQPVGNVYNSDTSRTEKGGCSMILGIAHSNTTNNSYGDLVFAPNNIGGSNSGDFCTQLKKSYESSGGPGNKVIPLSSTNTIEF